MFTNCLQGFFLLYTFLEFLLKFPTHLPMPHNHTKPIEVANSLRSTVEERVGINLQYVFSSLYQRERNSKIVQIQIVCYVKERKKMFNRSAGKETVTLFIFLFFIFFCTQRQSGINAAHIFSR